MGGSFILYLSELQDFSLLPSRLLVGLSESRGRVAPVFLVGLTKFVVAGSRHYTHKGGSILTALFLDEV